MQSRSQSHPPRASPRRCHCWWTLARPSAISSPSAISRKKLASVRASWRASASSVRPMGRSSAGRGCALQRRAAPRKAASSSRASSSRDVSPQAPSSSSVLVRAVEPRLGAPGDAVADEQREDVVAVLALRGRHVHLEPVAEPEERLGAVAVVDEPVERREQRCALRDWPVDGVGVRAPLAVLAPDAERAETLLGERALRVAERDGLRRAATAARRDPTGAGRSRRPATATSPYDSSVSSIRAVKRLPCQRCSPRPWQRAT